MEAGDEEEIFGKSTGLHGEMGAVCLFKKPLDDTHIGKMFKQGTISS